MKPIPFELPDVGLREINGKVFLEDGFLVLKLQDAFLGEFDKDKKEIRIEPAALSQVRLDKGVLKDRLVLRPADERLLEAVPGDHDLEVELRIWRNKRDDVRSLVRAITELIDAT